MALGVALLILWTLTHMALLSWADLSYVLPVTAIGYVLTSLSGKYLLGETISLEHWAGIWPLHPASPWSDRTGDDRGERTAMRVALVFILVTSTT